jgi:O-antigen/teichoic acid export membrane protein
MIKLSPGEFVYYGLLIIALALYLPLYVKHRKEIIHSRHKSARWGIVVSFAIIGIMSIIFHMVSWLPALLSSGVACLLAYYVIFVKYRD